MDHGDDAALRHYVSRWHAAGTVLARLRDQDIRKADTASALKAFTGGSELAARNHPPAPTSGLIEQQRWFQKLNGKS
jgi:hypothetical protein